MQTVRDAFAEQLPSAQAEEVGFHMADWGSDAAFVIDLPDLGGAKRIQAMGLLEDTGEVQKDVAHRAARLYQFHRARYRELKRRGFLFEV